jgi:raffinose/stachyose/melibiose transport system substrate-binding protein
MRHQKARLSFAVALGAATVLTVAACAPGPSSSSSSPSSAPPTGTSSSAAGSGNGQSSSASGLSTSAGTGSGVNTDPATMGTIKLTVWDQETSPGISNSLDELNKQFHAKYPNITINRVVMSGTDLRTTLKLQLSSNNPPDVAQANQGFADMGSYVKAGLLTNLAPYNEAYGWSKRIPSSQLALDSMTPDGSKLGTGNLYGVSGTGEVVGIFYNKSILRKLNLPVPTSIEEFESQLPKIKAAGVLPIEYGDQNLSPSIHLWGVTLIPALGHTTASALVFGGNASWTDPAVAKTATTLQDWSNAGYLSPGANGVSSNSAATAFGKGGAAYFLAGTWNENAITAGLGASGAGFLVLPETAGGPLTAMGGLGMGWAIPTNAKHKDASAAYINFITDANAAQVLIQNNQLPAVPPANFKADPNTLLGNVLADWAKLTAANGLAPYIDWSTPTMYTTLSTNLQLLLANKITVPDFVKAVQADHDKFYSGS